MVFAMISVPTNFTLIPNKSASLAITQSAKIAKEAPQPALHATPLCFWLPQPTFVFPVVPQEPLRMGNTAFLAMPPV
jgi:hypothetical protein